MRLAVLLALFLSSLAIAQTPLEEALNLYNRTQYEEALKILLPLKVKSAPVYELIGKSYFMSGDFKRASQYFEKAIQLDPGNSSYHNWLGKAYGRRAEMANILAAPGLASKARKSFEKAVELDPRNLEATNDLLEYYLEAPGFLGGGIDKAAALSGKIREVDPIEYHWAQAKIAEKRKEFHTAELQLRRAAELAPQQIGRLLDLAKFLARQGKVQESEAAFAAAEKLAPGSPKIMFEKASTYIRLKHNLETARRLLQQYLRCDLTPDLPSKAEAEKLLKASYGG